MNERQVFEAALDLPSGGLRDAYLDEACGPDTPLRARLKLLLVAHENLSQFLEVSAAEQLNPADERLLDPHATVQTADSAGPIRNAADDESVDDESLDLSFLKPSSKSGSIGMIGPYEVLQLIGHGAFGIVFKAFDEKLQRVVAIKTMNLGLAATSPPRKRFLREARSAAAVANENVVHVYSVEEVPFPYIVMEFIDGKTLQQTIDEGGPLELTEILHLGQQMANGLAAAHAQNLIHRDIKPGNILIDSSPLQKVKITDFGLARAVDDASMTRTGVISGTPMFMAPEQALGQALDHRSDLFSLGSVLYYMSCGRPPFRSSSTVAMLKRVAEDAPRSLQEIIPEIPDWLEAIIHKLHAKNPDDRFQSAEELSELFARCQTVLQDKDCIISTATLNIPSKSSSIHKSSLSGYFRELLSFFSSIPRHFLGSKRIVQISIVVFASIAGIMGYIYVAQPWGPGPNGPWSAADHNRDGTVYRDEMELFGKQAPHRNAARLMMHFDAADKDQNGLVTQDEIDAYGTDIGSRDPFDRPAPN